MRALIFELRPESLEMEGLVATLGKQADALRARHRLDVRTYFDGEPEVPLSTKETLYRLIQEALHNTVKHANAGQVDLSLAQRGHSLIVEIRDNGQGFDPQAEYPGHGGLQPMRERVEQLGGVFEIESRPGHGTSIRVEIQD